MAMEAVNERAEFLVIERGGRAAVVLMQEGEAHSVDAARILWRRPPRGLGALVRDLVRTSRRAPGLAPRPAATPPDRPTGD
jgi:hypothetical protein